MTSIQDLENAIFLLSSRSDELDVYRDGDIVFYATKPQKDGVPVAGYAILADSTHYYAFDPYGESAKPHPVLLPEGVSFYYHGSVPVDPKNLSLEDTLALLWKAHREALEQAGEELLQTDTEDFKPGEIILQERLDGYLALNMHGDELGYPKAPAKKHFWSHKPSLIDRPFTERHLLRTLAASNGIEF